MTQKNSKLFSFKPFLKKYFIYSYKYFYISQGSSLSAKQKRIDTENSDVERIEIDGHQGFYAVTEGRQLVYLDMGNLLITIYGNIEKQELIRMARNLEFLEK